MMENYEFYALLFSILGGFAASFSFMMSIRAMIASNTERVLKLETCTKYEFEKCPYHNSGTEMKNYE